MDKLKKPMFFENDSLAASQDALIKTITIMDSKVLKRYLIKRLENYQVTNNQFNFLLDVSIDSLKEFEGEKK